MLRKQMVHCWELIPKALFISLPEVQSLQCGASCLWNVLFINQGLKWPPVFKKYNKLLKVCFGSNYEENMFLQISDFRVDLFCLSACPTAVELLVIGVSILEYSPLADVAHDISPVPVLNCEQNGPETHSKEFCPLTGASVLTGKWEQSLKLVSKAAENAPNICGLSTDGSVEWYPESRVCAFHD